MKSWSKEVTKSMGGRKDEGVGCMEERVRTTQLEKEWLRKLVEIDGSERG